MDDVGDAARGYAAYLIELKRELASLERFPRSSFTQALALGLGAPILVAGLFGMSPLPVPAYLLLPFVAIPGWRLVQHERSWRLRKRTLTERIRLIEQRPYGGNGEEHNPS